MSYDFATEQICTHEVVRETGTIEPIHQLTVPFQQPPAHRGSVTVEIDGVVVPPSGLYSIPQLPFLKPGPYRIQAGVNDLLFFQFGFDPPQFVQLLTGTDIAATDMAADLQIKIPSVSVSVQNSRVTFTALQPTSGTAFAFPDPRWTDKTSSLPTTARVLAACTQLGILPGRFVIGKQIYPGWSVVIDPSSVTGTGRLLQFQSPLLNAEAVIQLTYVTTAPNCRRCFGSKFEYDYSITNGTYDIVQDTDLLSQEFDKFLYTKIGSHWKWPWLGSDLVNRIGGKGTTGQATINALINSDISQAFKTYQNIKQQQDSRFPFQLVSDAEYPASLININVVTLPNDPTVAVASTTITSRSRVAVPLKRMIGTPSPFTFGPGSPTYRLAGGS
jgi:hypothetical protein